MFLHRCLCDVGFIIGLRLISFGKTGPVAHLVERFHGMEEAVGSIPIRSTSTPRHCSTMAGFLFTHQAAI